MESELVTPVIQQARETMDLKERTRLFTIAGVNHIVHPAAELVAAKFTRRIAKIGIRKAGSMMDREIEPLLKFYTILLNAIKAEK